MLFSCHPLTLAASFAASFILANHYEDLFRVYKKILTLCAVGELSRHSVTVSKKSVLSSPFSPFGIQKKDLDGMLQLEGSDEDERSNYAKPKSAHSWNRSGLFLDPKYSDSGRGIISPSEKAKIDDLLGAWEEPDVEASIVESASINNVLEFRNALAKLDKPYMLGIAWGDVGTREKMICTSQAVYWKLRRLSSDPEVGLQFDVLAALTEQLDGTLHPDELKHLIRLLRPDRQGVLSLAEFVKSIDSVYKEAKLVHASVKNSEKIDREFEKALNIPFYTVVMCIILSQIGLNPLTLFISLSPLILGFSWMIGSASSKMFEGWLFILVRRPYNIGDRIHIGNVESDCSWEGSACTYTNKDCCRRLLNAIPQKYLTFALHSPYFAAWIVQDVTLFHTVAVFGPTGERASMPNGSLASSRVLNMARSPNACVYVNLQFPTSVTYERIQKFEVLLRDFVQARPREWAHFAAFRATSVIANLGLIGYEVMLIHRESWQYIQSIYESKAQVASFALELSKKLDMRYESPALPVDLRFAPSHRGDHSSLDDENVVDRNATRSHPSDESIIYQEWMAMRCKT
jgi:small-conductance mechanosensitive channel